MKEGRKFSLNCCSTSWKPLDTNSSRSLTRHQQLDVRLPVDDGSKQMASRANNLLNPRAQVDPSSGCCPLSVIVVLLVAVAVVSERKSSSSLAFS